MSPPGGKLSFPGKERLRSERRSFQSLFSGGMPRFETKMSKKDRWFSLSFYASPSTLDQIVLWTPFPVCQVLESVGFARGRQHRWHLFFFCF